MRTPRRDPVPRVPELVGHPGGREGDRDRGRQITRDLIQLLNTQYVTPFDREDIYELATKLDDVVDYIEEAADLLELYGIESTTKHAVEQCRILVQAVEQLALALPG